MVSRPLAPYTGIYQTFLLSCSPLSAMKEHSPKALTEGVKGFITKDESVEGVATALIRAKKGMSTMSAHPIELLVSAYQSEQRRQRNAAQEQRKIMNLPPRLRKRTRFYTERSH